MEKDFDNNNENCIEWLSGERTCTVTFTNRKHIRRIKSLYEDEHWRQFFKRYYENKDGSICATIPSKWVKINPGSKVKRELSDEQKKAFAERMRKVRENSK